MSARRSARALRNAVAPRVVDGVPACLKVGACAEVWDPEHRNALVAWRRFRDVRTWWLDTHGVTKTQARHELVQESAPWNVQFLTYRGQAERVGRPVGEIVRDRLARAGCTVLDLPELAAEAQVLHDLAYDEADMWLTHRRQKASTTT